MTCGEAKSSAQGGAGNLKGVDVGCVGEARSDTERRDRAVFGPGLDPSGWDSGLGWELRSAIGESKPDTAPN